MRPAQVLAPLLFGALGACGGTGSDTTTTDDGGACSPSSFTTSTLATVTGDSGKLRVAVRSAPYASLIEGTQCVELVVTDASTGVGVDGLSVKMTPWMPAMGHGASVTPVVSTFGEGRYVFTNVTLFMPGEWQLRTQFAGEVNDSVEPTFNVD